MSGSGRETLPEVREAHSEVWECSEGPPRSPGGPLKCPRVFEGLPVCPGVVWETLADVRECSGGPPKCPGAIGRPVNVRE